MPTSRKGIIFGDSLAVTINNNSSAITSLLAYTITNMAVFGDFIADQQADWDASPNKGDQSFDWGFILLGINNISNSGQSDPTSIISQMTSFCASITSVMKPGFKLYLSKLTPCKQWMDGLGAPDRYPRWQAVNTGYAAIPGVTYKTEVSGTLNDGADSLNAADEQAADHLHFNNAAGARSSGIIRGWLETDVPFFPLRPAQLADRHVFRGVSNG